MPVTRKIIEYVHNSDMLSQLLWRIFGENTCKCRALENMY